MEIDTPENLFAAIEQCNVVEVENLLAKGADPNEVDVHGYQSTPLAYACSHGDEAAVRVLLDAKADLNAAAFEPPLVAATKHGFANLVTLLVKAGADVNVADETGASALWTAAANGFADIARCLVEAGANREQADNDGKLPAIVALENGHAALSKYLSEPTSLPSTHSFWRGSKKRARDAAKERRTQVINAATGQSASAAAEPEWTFSGGIAKSQWVTQDFPSVAASGNVDLVRRMLDAGLDPDWTQFKGNPTGLMQAALSGALDVVELLLARHAKVNHRTDKGLTALHMALFKPSARVHGPIVRSLLAAGADPNAPDNEGQRPLQRALTHAIPALVQALLEAGADPFIRDRAGRMPADWAPADGKHAGAIRDLLEAARK
ncbi:ankyrin repeat domain-containing protein [Pyxidicoccus fallax]|uniref:Ankyrin repeat domain-containing protein n=1 Tax=Pyxidicoccus fallax TaxID=394095 RepID=A0A848LBV4_9BACT|nr:ankyrin repeat domain-containing protein [Pyxidicoccus fallax]NMO15722.1 ankyrin repeat domain-containing protein [Pyxidicoccus fallax]NPC77129.1 ankyrin repeat domain-containing protein [Pyxidicoccus fallax]